MNLETIQNLLLSRPEVGDWPELAGLLHAAAESGSIDWKLPLVACEAVGGDPEAALPCAAAVLCLQISILIVDDILDEDPRGVHHDLGVGPTANLALALEALAFSAVSHAFAPAERRAAALETLSAMALTTAEGQHLDVKHTGGEAGYWALVRAKSTPFYGAALKAGAQIGGADGATADKLYELGLLVGEIVQLHDDMFDAFETPAKPDWRRQTNNLLILYALTAETPERERFIELLDRMDEPGSLAAAQEILIRGGALSYCGFHLLDRHARARSLFAELDLPAPETMIVFLNQQMEPINALFEKVGAELPQNSLLGNPG